VDIQRQAAEHRLDTEYWRRSVEQHREATARVDDDLACLRVRFRELSALRSGWLDCAGEAVDSGVLQQARLLLDQLLNWDVPRPRVFPTIEGGVQLEWSQEPYEVSVSIQPGEASVYAVKVNVRTGEAEEWELPPSSASIAGVVLSPTP
jgi:hypothetical protein